MGIGTTDYQLNQNQMTQAKPAKTSEILKNSTVLLFLSALGICFSTCSYSLTKGYFEKKQPTVKKELSLSYQLKGFAQNNR